jgi:heme/copper-type cytochrome/quinol oxidase subunit 2
LGYALKLLPECLYKNIIATKTRITKLAEVNLAADLGYGVPWLVETLTVAILVTTGFIIYVMLSTRSDKITLSGFDKAKYRLYKYHAERYWAIFVAGILIWFWFLGIPWMPSMVFDNIPEDQIIHVVKVSAGQWFWKIEDGGYTNKSDSRILGLPDTQKLNTSNFNSNINKELYVKAGETVKFIANSEDVNHGFGILSSSKSMDSILMQMQVVPGYENIFYYTFDKPGTYTIRCLEYCGCLHP